jgi:hypothetical protein
MTSIEPRARGVRPTPLARHPNNRGSDKHLISEIVLAALEDQSNSNHEYTKDSRCPTNWTSQQWESRGNCWE